MEAFVNYIADSLFKADSIEKYEIAFLNDKSLLFDAKRSMLTQKIEYHKLDDKLKVLITRFVPDFDYGNTTWESLIDFKKFRDSLVHPRHDEDETSISVYETKVRRGLSGIIHIMNCISKGMFTRPLRQKIQDLLPE
ncbi:MAG: hypothetical protein ACYDHW_06320 [Syntrophorhabdaceae bacterium]